MLNLNGEIRKRWLNDLCAQNVQFEDHLLSCGNAARLLTVYPNWNEATLCQATVKVKSFSIQILATPHTYFPTGSPPLY